MCCFEKLFTFEFENLTKSEYDEIGRILESLNFGKYQIKALVSEAKKFGKMRITHIDESDSEFAIEELQKNKINYKFNKA